MRMIIVAFGALLFCGCNGGFLKIDPALAAPFIEKAAATTTTLGLKALASDAETYGKMKAVVEPLQAAIDATIIPLFQGDDLSKITRATADKALVLLDEKIPPEIKGVIQLAVNGALGFLTLPENPAASLEPGQVAVIVALLRGIGTGASAFVAWGGPGAKGMEAVPVVLEITWKGGRAP